MGSLRGYLAAGKWEEDIAPSRVAKARPGEGQRRDAETAEETQRRKKRESAAQRESLRGGGPRRPWEIVLCLVSWLWRRDVGRHEFRRDGLRQGSYGRLPGAALCR
jgi:hypothetical protein